MARFLFQFHYCELKLDRNTHEVREFHISTQLQNRRDTMQRKILSRDNNYITNLPESITETIIIKLPLKDAVRTSILSSKWRYKWTTLIHLYIAKSLSNFITRFLLLHNGPINTFVLSTSYQQSSPDVHQWLLYLSRKDVKELVLELEVGWFRAPSCLFSCQKLIRLELLRWGLNPPLSFKGFLFLKHLNFQQVGIDPIELQNLISSCPALKSLNISNYDSLELTIRAPNLKFLTLEGNIKDMCLENTPMLVSIDVSMYKSDDISQHFGQNSTCNFDKFFGGVPSLQNLIGRSYFTKYMSIGNTFGKTDLKYQQLKVIDLSQVSFDTMKEIMVLLRLILNAPNLEELQIAGSSDSSSATKAPDLGFWEKQCRFDLTFDQLKTVKMMEMFGVPHEVGFIGFLLGNSPLLETMSITPSVYMTKDRFSFLIQLTKLKRRPTEAEMIFVQS